MTKKEMMERIEELEDENKELLEELKERDDYSKYDKAAEEMAYLVKQLINAFRKDGLTNDQAYEMTTVVIKGAIK